MNGSRKVRTGYEIILMLCILAFVLIILSILDATMLAIVLVISVMIVVLALLGFDSKVKLHGDSVEVETYKNRKNSSSPRRKDE